MKSLIIETSTERGLVAILEDAIVLQEMFLPMGYNQSNTLFSHLKALFNASPFKLQDMDCIGVGVGPGSYTGIRVGASAAKTLAYACKKPLIGVCTLYGFVSTNPLGSHAAIIDAKMGGCYLLRGEPDAQPEVVPLDLLAQKLGREVTLVTPFAARLQAKLMALYPDNEWQWIEVPPSAARLGWIVQEKFSHGEVSLDGHLELMYLRKTEAEMEKARAIGCEDRFLKLCLLIKNKFS